MKTFSDKYIIVRSTQKVCTGICVQSTPDTFFNHPIQAQFRSHIYSNGHSAVGGPLSIAPPPAPATAQSIG